MRRRFARTAITLTLSLLLTTLPACASQDLTRIEAASAFETGNRLYRQGDYPGAVGAYEDALATGYASGALYHNMGNAHFRLDRLGQAIRFYEKARRLLPNDPTLLHDLDIARSRTTDQFPTIPEPYWDRWWRTFAYTVGTSTLFWTGLLLYVAAAALLGYRILSGVRSPWLRRTLTVTATAGIIVLAAAFAASLTPERPRRAVLISELAPLRPAPDDGAATDTTVHEGLLLTILDEREGWLHVRLPDGTTGWIEARTVAAV